ncbi:MAG: ADP-ribose pyrophosphatase, partial [Anaerolineaceae bacterium]|nr:ADP-ribose pyrophosphatase [Anaerolineaceae bacterium]
PFPFHIYKLFFQCEILGGEAAESLETGGARFFPINDYPPLSISRVTAEELDLMFFLVDHPELPTDFD